MAKATAKKREVIESVTIELTLDEAVALKKVIGNTMVSVLRANNLDALSEALYDVLGPRGFDKGEKPFHIVEEIEVG